MTAQCDDELYEWVIGGLWVEYPIDLLAHRRKCLAGVTIDGNDLCGVAIKMWR